MYARSMWLAVFLSGAVTTLPPVVVERATGRVVVAQSGKLDVLAADLATRAATLPAPPGEVTLLDFAGGVVVYAFTLPEDGSPALAAVGVEDGIERLIWPNAGIGERFPTPAARLTVDGGGIFEFLILDGALREELGLGKDIPDGAGAVVTYRFSDERVWAIAAADFTAAVALAPGDALVLTADGGLLRYRSPTGVVWRRPGGGEGRFFLDVHGEQNLALLGTANGVEVVSLQTGTGQRSWQGGRVSQARLLGDGRLLVATGEGEVLVIGSEGAQVAVPFARLAGEEWKRNVAACATGGHPLPCLHPVPRGVIVPGPTGWQLITLPAAPTAPGVGR